VEIDGRKFSRPTPLGEPLSHARRRKEKLLRESLWKELRRLLERIAFLEDIPELAIPQEVPQLVGERPTLTLNGVRTIHGYASTQVITPDEKGGQLRRESIEIEDAKASFRLEPLIDLDCGLVS
jgi:hypothetical protein